MATVTVQLHKVLQWHRPRGESPPPLPRHCAKQEVFLVFYSVSIQVAGPRPSLYGLLQIGTWNRSVKNTFSPYLFYLLTPFENLLFQSMF